MHGLRSVRAAQLCVDTGNILDGGQRLCFVKAGGVPALTVEPVIYVFPLSVIMQTQEFLAHTSEVTWR